MSKCIWLGLTLNLFLLPSTMGKDNSAQYFWFLISQTQKIGLLHVVASDEDACKKIANQLLHRLPNLNLLSLLPYSTNVIGKPKCSWKPVVYQQQFLSSV